MRRLGHRAQGAEEVRKAGHETAKREPLAEDIRKGRFSRQEAETLRTRRAELIAEGLTDGAISRALSREFRRPVYSIGMKIRTMRKSGELSENPNMQKAAEFSSADLALIARKRPELIGQGMGEMPVSAALSKELGIPYHAVYHKIHTMVESGELPANPNKREVSRFTAEDIALISRRRGELIKDGLTDGKISRVISARINRSVHSIVTTLHNMVKSGKLPENPNKRKKSGFSADEVALLAKGRAELMRQGMCDEAISGVLSGEIPRPAASIAHKIHTMAKSGRLPKNPNNRAGFSREELEELNRRRAELVEAGLSDTKISELLCNVIARTPGTIRETIRRRVKSGSMQKNPNGQSQFTAPELSLLRKRRPELIGQGLTDGEISKSLSRELQHTAQSTMTKIRNMVRSGELPENPNLRQTSRFTRRDLAHISRRWPELINHGLTNRGISIALSSELEHPARSIYIKLRNMVKSGKLAENPNKWGRRIPEGELLGRLKEAVSLYTEVSE